MTTTTRIEFWHDGGYWEEVNTSELDFEIELTTYATGGVCTDKDTEAALTAELRRWVKGGEWGQEGAAVRAAWRLIDVETGDVLERKNITVDIEPDHESLIHEAVREHFGAYHEEDVVCGYEPHDHDWISTVEVDGGLKENPGVFATGGTSMAFYSHCEQCGLRREETHTGSQCNPGEHDTVRYFFE